MKLTSNALKLCAAALLAVSGSVRFSYAAAPPRVNPAFLRYVSATSSSTYRVKTAAAAHAPGHHFGWRPSPVDMSHMAGRDISGLISRRTGVSAAGARTAYDPSYDLRTHGKLTAIRDQNPYGDCWAFAAYGSMESGLLPSETRDFSENNLAMNSGFDAADDDPMNSGGNSSMSAAYLARWDGPVNETDDPHDGHRRTGLAVRKHMQEMFWLPQSTSAPSAAFENNIKSAITAYGAVYSIIYWDNNALESNNASY